MPLRKVFLAQSPKFELLMVEDRRSEKCHSPKEFRSPSMIMTKSDGFLEVCAGIFIYFKYIYIKLQSSSLGRVWGTIAD